MVDFSMISFITSLTCSLSLLSVLAQAQELSYSQLLDRTHDLRYLCEMPLPGERSEQLRLAVDAGSLEYSITGPAVISRIFVDSTSGELAIDFGATKLLVDLGDVKRLVAAPLATNYGNATVISLPITIAADAKLTVSGTTASHLDIDVWYPAKGAVLPNSNNKFLRSQRRAIDGTIRVLVANDRPVTLLVPNPKKTGVAYFRSAELPPSSTNGEFRWLIRGNGVVRWMEIRFVHKEAPAEIEELLRSLVLKIEYGCDSIEEESDATVEMPLGDFFANYRGANGSNSYLLGYNQDTQTFYCRLPMPFRDSVRFSIASDIVKPARFVMSAGVDKLLLDEVPPLTLRSNFVRATDVSSASSARLKVSGIARMFAAMFSFTSSSSLALEQNNDFAFANTSQVPLYSMGENVLLRQGPGAFGNNSFVRWYHVAAPSTVKELVYNPQLSLPSDVETDYSFSAWWYGTLDSKVEGATTYSVAQRLHAEKPQPNFFVLSNATEAEHTTTPRMSKGSMVAVEMVDPSLAVSALQYSKWTPSDSMQAVIYDFAIAESGTFDFKVQLMTGPEFGKVQVLIDGRATGEVIECHSDGLGITGLIDIGTVRMMARESHSLGFRSVDEKTVGVDCYIVSKTEKK